MRELSRCCLIAILIAGLLNVPAFAANEKPLGLVTQAQDAQIGNSKVAVGTTIFPGDSLATEIGGTLRMKVGTSQLYLLSSSSATLAQNSDIVHAVVGRGTVGFSSNGTDKLELEIPEGIVRAADGQPAYGQVTITGPQEVVISAYRGALILDNDGDIHMIAAGKSYRVTMDLEATAAEPPQGPVGAGTKGGVVPTRRRHLLFALITLGVVAGASYGIWYVLSESPSSPN
jgi:hypothetical protein